MKSELPNTCLQEVLAFSNGRTSTVRNEKLTIPVYGANGLIGMAAEANSSPNTIIIGRVGSYCGSVHFSKTSCWITDNAIKAIAKESNDPLFLYYLLKHLNLNTWRSGSGQPLINQAILNSIPIFAPLPVQQRSISSTLGALDDRITLLRETNTTLEAIAQALFKSWFIDFDPVHAKMQGQAPQGMDEATAALFPDSFEESELGPIPKGWPISTIENTLETVGGATPDTKIQEYWEPAEYFWTTPKDLSGISSPILLSTDRKVSSAGLKKIGSGLLPVGSLLMSSRAPIGYLALTNSPMAINQGYIAFPPGGKLSPNYMLFWCQFNMENIKARANGSTFMEISKKALRPIPLIIPPQAILEKFESLAKGLISRLIENEIQSQNLTLIRDTLLPRLISGQLEIPEVKLS